MSFHYFSTKGKNKIYLVKWQDLGYEFSTWEDPRDAPDGLEDFDKQIDAYWKRRTERLKAEKEKGDSDKPKKAMVSCYFCFTSAQVRFSTLLGIMRCHLDKFSWT